MKAKAGTGSATLSMAFAGARFAVSLCRALKGEPNIIECCYVESNATDAKFFSTPILLGVSANLKLSTSNRTIGKCGIFCQCARKRTKILKLKIHSPHPLIYLHVHVLFVCRKMA